MKLATSRLPLSLVATGGILIIISFLWSYVIPPARINDDQMRILTEAAGRGHETATADPSQSGASRPTIDESMSEEDFRQHADRARHEIQRKLFLRNEAPKFVNYLGVLLAVIGCILYPLQLLARQAQVEAEQAEEDGTTVVE